MYLLDNYFFPPILEKLQKHKWESAIKLDRLSWGYRKQMKVTDLLTIKEILRTLAEVISCGGIMAY